VIRADKAVPALEIQKAMTIIGQAGIDDISFSTLNQE
jgi:biopolymer transport protein ExbD